MKQFITVVTLLLAYSLLNAAPAHAAPGGELDASFGENGRVVITVSLASFGSAGVQQADGKLVVAGSAEFAAGGGFDFVVLRLNVDGTRDTTFGNGRLSYVDFGGISDGPSVVLLQPDGKIIAAGSADSEFSADSKFALARFNANGTLDTTFGTDGRARLDLGGGHERATGAVLVPGGQIVVAGTSNANGSYDVVFARLNANGTLDTTFGTNGRVFVDTNGERNEALWLTQQADGKLIACGSVAPDPDSTFMQAVRVNANGTVDTTFGVAGVAIIDTGTMIGVSTTCAALPDGTLVLAGASGSSDDADLALAKLTSAGILDHSFGVGGQASADLGRFERVEAMLPLSDGKLGVAGTIEDSEFSRRGDIFIARFSANGSLDTTFGNNGATIADFGDEELSANSFASGFVEQSDGKLVAIGSAAVPGDFYGFAIARVNSDGEGNAGVVGFVETRTAVREEDGNAVLTVRRTGGSVGAVTVDYATAAGTALPGLDFEDASHTLTWNDGDVEEKSITINLIDDSNPEENESLRLSLTSLTGGAVLAASEASINIHSDEGFLLRATSVSVDENADTVQILVERIGASNTAASVDYSTVNGTANAGSDYSATSGTLTWAAGDPEAIKTIEIPITDDPDDESNESFTVSLSNVTGGIGLAGDRTATVTIADDDAPPPLPPNRGGGGGIGFTTLLPLLLLLRRRRYLERN